MKRKILRTALALLLSLACLPSWAAADGETSQSEEPLAFAFNITGAGSDDILNLNTSGDYAVRDTLLNDYIFAPPADITAFRYMGAAYNLAEDSLTGGVTPLFLRNTGGPTTHELTLYSNQRLDPAMLQITSGTGGGDPSVPSWETFTGGHFGGGSSEYGAGEIFWYRTTITIPQDTSQFLVVMYQQRVVGTWQMHRISGFGIRNAIFPTQLYPVAYEDDAEGNITDFTIEIAGMNLPSSRSAYAMENCTLTDFAGPDAAGTYTLTFHYDGPGEAADARNALLWVPLLINGQSWNYFKTYHLIYDEETRQYSLNSGKWEAGEDGRLETWGTPAEMATPYYNILLGGTLDQQSAPLVAADPAGNVRYHAVQAWNPGATLACAWFDGDGRMISCDIQNSADVRDAVVFQTTDTRAAEARVMVLDAGLVPVKVKIVSLAPLESGGGAAVPVSGGGDGTVR